MARIPDDRDRQIRDPNLGGVDRGGAWIGWWWVWFFIIIVAAFWFAGWGWGGYGGWWWGRRPAVAEVSPNSVVTGSGIAIMDAPDKAVYAGQRFQLNEVPVQKKVSDKAMWVGTRSSGPMLVVATQANAGAPAAETNNKTRNRNNRANRGNTRENAAANNANTTTNNGAANTAMAPLNAIPANIAQGDRVQVTGTVQKAPPPNVATQQWGLSTQGAQQLQKQGAYVQLEQVARDTNPVQR